MLRTAPLSAVLNEEIALEGLEGSTLDVLWNHLALRLKIVVPLPHKLQNSIWQLIIRHPEYSFFVLPEPRKPFVFFDRMDQVDPESGVMREPKEFPGHRFHYNPVVGDGVRGSCEHYAHRIALSREEVAQMTHEQVEEKWPNAFVIVASQKLREMFIIEPNNTLELSIIQFCILEWVGRSRYNGETSQGKYSLVEITKDSAILFYNRKVLIEGKLMTRQSLCQRTGESSIQGMVYHLPRYYQEMKPKGLVLTEKVVNILKMRPGYMADYDEIKQIVLGRAEARKWFRGNEFVKFIKTDETVPYRLLYPDADKREWQMRNKKGEEKQVRVMRLIDPEADVYDMWYSKDDQAEDEQKDGILNSQKAYIDMPVLQQAYNVIGRAGEQGISQSMMATEMGLDKLNSRSVVRNLLKLKAIEGHAVDEGRQRTTKYFIPGRTQRTLTFDKEAIQLMNAHINVFEQQQLEKQQKELDEVSNAITSTYQPLNETVTAPTTPVPNESFSSMHSTLNDSTSSFSAVSNILTDGGEDDDDCELLQRSSFKSTLLQSIDVEIELGEKANQLKKVEPGIASTMMNKTISTKVLKRCNMILETVRKYKVIEPRAVLKEINKQEKDSGCKTEACHKSILRLMSRLAVDKLMKIANVKLSKENKVVTLTLACESSIEKDHGLLLAKIESAKARMMMHNPALEAGSSKKKATTTTNTEEYPLTPGHSYEGTLAKFRRMKLFHEFLFYLIYELPKSAEEIPPPFDLKVADLGLEAGPFYSNDEWKMFVPPLQDYENNGSGWALLTDVTLRLPLSIFCQICTFGFYTKDLDHYLDHPVRRHILIKHLPKPIRMQLSQRRKYIFNIYELCQKLCCAGLLQFGPQRMKDKDQTFIYLNRNIALIDTRSSAVGYQEIEEKEYPKMDFTLTDFKTLEEFWGILYKIAMETRLNRRSVAVGKEILVQQIQNKPKIIEAFRARTFEDASENDYAKLPPGDNRGAAGMDTAMFIHLKSNWIKVMNYAPAEPKPKASNMKTVRKIVAMNREKANKIAMAKKTASAGLKDKKLTLKPKLAVKQFANHFRRYGDKKSDIKIRKVAPRAAQTRIRSLYDETDKKALRLMKKLRVDWNRNEDTILLTCRIAVKYLFGEVNKCCLVINSVLFRDILHWSDPCSMNKTSRACQRRINYMMKHKPHLADLVKMCVEEARINTKIEQQFGKNFLEDLKQTYTVPEDLSMALKVRFVELVYLLQRTLTKLGSDSFRSASERDTSNQLVLPDTMKDFLNRYEIIQDHNTTNLLLYMAPSSIEDIIQHKLITLIHSSVTNLKEKSSINVQLFNIYKHFSEKQLSQAMKTVRSFKMISLSRNGRAERSVAASIMPAVDSPYHVAVTYLNQISTKIPFEMFNYVYFHYLELLDATHYGDPITFENTGQGIVLLLGELTTKNATELEIESLVNLIQVNPDMRIAPSELKDMMNDLSAGDTVNQMTSIGPATEIKTEPRSAAKITINTASDVYFNFVMHPVERLTKLPNEYLHFFCLLNSLTDRVFIKGYKIDETYNLCSVAECIMQDSERDVVNRCISIALSCREAIERIKKTKVSRLDIQPAFLVREDNIAHCFSRTVQEYGKYHSQRTLRDIGKLPAGMRTSINMVELADDIVRFDSVSDFNWLDRYEITQPVDSDTTMMMDDTNGEDFSMASNHKDDYADRAKKYNNYYIINCPKMNIRLKYDHPNQLQERVFHNGREIANYFLPAKYHEREAIQTRITSDCLWPDSAELNPLLEQATPFVNQNPRLHALAEFIESKQELGATVLQLTEQFTNRQELLEDLATLEGFKYILRTGIRHVTFVHWQFVQPWLVNTTCVIEEINLDGEPSSKDIKPAMMARKRKYDATQKQEDDCHVLGEPMKKSRRQLIENSLEQAEMRDRFKPKKDLSLAMMPWLRVDGILNKRLLYRWLTTVLLYCMSHPGIMLTVIHGRFNLMSPVQLNYLLELLQEYGCVRLLSVKVKTKKTLFTSFRSGTIDKATILDPEELTYVEAVPNALTMLSLFLGDYAKFQEDFLTPSTYIDIRNEDDFSENVRRPVTTDLEDNLDWVTDA
ncbi:general transcription factor 3C polypeptide 1 [Uranotaenia lowii]|uniref:general transcription factor 3C polypeptide 1 n=1 Tax=Uranotaenia lowii TaxID=190385 RepID=UPI00247848FA|nr:general transcription factor 3C polypeptide 1 [Uranotaenia lowii]